MVLPVENDPHEDPRMLARLRELMLAALTARQIPLADAEDAAHDALERIIREPAEFLPRLEDLERHAGYFVKMALNELRMKLRSEHRRRGRERAVSGDWQEQSSEQPDEAAFSSADAALSKVLRVPGLTDLQRQYLYLTLVEDMSAVEIGESTGTSERAVRAVLARAREILRDYFDNT